jgi:hypothetical protein
MTTEQPWLFGTMSRTEAESQLQQLDAARDAADDRAAHPTFLVRSGAVGLTISALADGQFFHVPVTTTPSGAYCAAQNGAAQRGTSLEALLRLMGFLPGGALDSDWAPEETDAAALPLPLPDAQVFLPPPPSFQQ